jgi:hypothetical protein
MTSVTIKVTGEPVGSARRGERGRLRLTAQSPTSLSEVDDIWTAARSCVSSSSLNGLSENHSATDCTLISPSFRRRRLLRTFAPSIVRSTSVIRA